MPKTKRRILRILETEMPMWDTGWDGVWHPVFLTSSWVTLILLESRPDFWVKGIKHEFTDPVPAPFLVENFHLSLKLKKKKKDLGVLLWKGWHSQSITLVEVGRTRPGMKSEKIWLVISFAERSPWLSGKKFQMSLSSGDEHFPDRWEKHLLGPGPRFKNREFPLGLWHGWFRP